MEHHQAGRLSEAEALYRQVIAAEPGRPEAWHHLGIIARKLGRPDLAMQWIGHALALQPGDPAALFELGLACSRADRLEEAVAAYRQALEFRPADPEACNNLATALVRLGKAEEALPIYERALALKPDFHDVHGNIGIALSGLGRRAEAIAAYQRALALRPDYVDAQYSLGVALAEEGRLEEALEAYRRTLQLQPDHAEACNNLGNVLKDRRQIPEAIEFFRRAVTCRRDFADAHVNLGLALLLLGQFEEGWQEYEWRPSVIAASRRNVAAPIWDGNPIPGQSILVRSEQGFGDTLQFIRYLPELCAQSRAGRVVLECQPELHSLLCQLQTPEVEIVARGEGQVHSLACDWQTLLLSLPVKLRLPAPLATSEPYLQADPSRRAAWRAHFPAFPTWRFGLSWQGRASFKNDHRRSIAPEKLLPLLRIPGIQAVSLQIQPHGSMPAILNESGMLDLTSQIADFADSAALIAELDLVITVDTATAHLAGALGKPVWLLLPFVPDWRWGLEGERTPWYPTVRLFRQSQPEDWDSVIQRVALELQALGRENSVDSQR